MQTFLLERPIPVQFDIADPGRLALARGGDRYRPPLR